MMVPIVTIPSSWYKRAADQYWTSRRMCVGAYQCKMLCEYRTIGRKLVGGLSYDASPLRYAGTGHRVAGA
eukprot:3940662-Rhodomonas_salina.4